MMRRRVLIGVSHLLRAAHLVLCRDTLLYLGVHTVAKSGADGTMVLGLLFSIPFTSI